MGLFSFKSNTREDLGGTEEQTRFYEEYSSEKNTKFYSVKQFFTSFNPALLVLLPFWICFLLLFLFNRPELQEIDFLADRFDTFLSLFKQYHTFR
jgi:hypothetical protein